MAVSRMTGMRNGGTRGRVGESAGAPAVPTGSTRSAASAAGGRHQTSGPKTLPGPVEPAGRADRALSTGNRTGLDTEPGGETRASRISRHVGAGAPDREKNQALQQTPAASADCGWAASRAAGAAELVR